jgi:two-component system response regulator HydG
MIRESFHDLLVAEGFAVDTAETAGEALRKAKIAQYDVGLLDIKLPDMDGTRLLEKLHAVQPTMIKIMVTGYSTLENAAKSMNYGAADYVLKPVYPETLIKLLKEKLADR